MSRPKWINTIGILMIVIAIFRFFSNYQLAHSPESLEKARETVEKLSNDTVTSIDDTINIGKVELRIKEDSLGTKDFGYLRDILGAATSPSAHFLKWVKPLGYIGMVVMVLYLMGGILLLLAKPYSVWPVYITLGLSALFYILVFTVMLSDSTNNYLSTSTALNRAPAILIDLIMLGVVIGADKFYIKGEEISD